MTRRRPFTALLLVAAFAAPVAAETFRVDDSASVVQSGRVQMKWDSVAPQRGWDPATLSGSLTVVARLDLSPWRARSGRIYLVLPMPPSGPLTVAWTTRGRLLPGTLRAGERTLVYAGPIFDDRLEDTLTLVLQADGRRLERPETLDFSFQIDLETL